MQIVRRIIFILLVAGLPVQPVGAGFGQRLKGVAKVASAASLALLAYIATDLAVVLAHEYGHYLGNVLNGGKGGTVILESNLFAHPLGPLAPFTGVFTHESGDANEAVTLAAGPAAGLAANYAIMVAANALYKQQNGLSKQESLKVALKSPLLVFQNISDAIERKIAAQAKDKELSFGELFMVTFNFLRATKLFGEFVYGFTPISTKNGDGAQLWRILGLKRDMSVPPYVGLSVALLPCMGAVAYGIAKGIYKRLNEDKPNPDSSLLIDAPYDRKRQNGGHSHVRL